MGLFLLWEGEAGSLVSLRQIVLGNGPHVLGNGPYVLGDGPQVLGNGNGPLVLGNGPHVLGIMFHWGLCHIRDYLVWDYVAFGVMSHSGICPWGLCHIQDYVAFELCSSRLCRSD